MTPKESLHHNIWGFKKIQLKRLQSITRTYIGISILTRTHGAVCCFSLYVRQIELYRIFDLPNDGYRFWEMPDWAWAGDSMWVLTAVSLANLSKWKTRIKQIVCLSKWFQNCFLFPRNVKCNDPAPWREFVMDPFTEHVQKRCHIYICI